MKVWRGIFTKKPRSEILARRFDHLPAENEAHLALILDKILDNFSNDGDTRKLTSFSKSKSIALRHAGTTGWLLQVEIESGAILDAEMFLESRRNTTEPGSSEWARLTEAKDMAHQDKEVFLRHGAGFKVTGTLMVGSWKSE